MNQEGTHLSHMGEGGADATAYAFSLQSAEGVR